MIPLHSDNPAELDPWLSVALIAACVLAFFWQLSFGPAQERAILALGVIPAVLFDLRQLAPGLALLLQFVNALTAGGGPGVAWHAHLGGFTAGLLLVPFFRRRGVPLFHPPHSRY
jgi:membrane associated rhomboid family serine protease